VNANGKKLLIVNADDFGLEHGVNRGVMRGFECGIVTSASLMVRGPAAVEAANYGRQHPQLSLGLHLDLGEWFYRDGAWLPRYEVVSLADASQVASELRRQLDSFRQLVGREPTHVDSHQHVHSREPVREVVLDAAAALNVPVRHCTQQVRYCGAFYGQTAEGHPIPGAIGVTSLIEILTTLPAGVTELACHPSEDGNLDSSYSGERPRELEALCHPRVRAAIDSLNIELCSFAQLSPQGKPR
jgi:predicted glycoside hydrolase/deacetylase ChbG (UPF0249 family)